LGSFTKAIADRSLQNKTYWGRSACPKCHHNLSWLDLLPILSFIFLKSRCRYCHKKISDEYIIVELVTGLLVAALFWQAFNNFQFSIFNFQSISNFQFSMTLFNLALKTFFVTVLVIITITDLKDTFIPDRVILPSLLVSFLALLAFTIYQIGLLHRTLTQTMLGRLLLPPHSDYFLRHSIYIAEPFLLSIFAGLLIGGFFLALIIITKGKGMGGGDVKVGALIGLVLGFSQGILAIMLAFMTGAAFSILLILAKKKKIGENIPFGPFLVLGSLIALFLGNNLISWYLSFSKF